MIHIAVYSKHASKVLLSEYIHKSVGCIFVNTDFSYALCELYCYPFSPPLAPPKTTKKGSQTARSSSAECALEETKQHRKPESKLNHKQRKEITTYYENNPYPNEKERELIAKDLRLTTEQVQKWFRRKQNMDLKKSLSSTSRK